MGKMMPFITRVCSQNSLLTLIYFSCNQEVSAKGGEEIFLNYLDTILEFSLNILLTYNGTACLFSVDMSSKQFHVHINQSNSEPRKKRALWIYSRLISLKVCTLHFFCYLLLHPFAPNCSDHCIFLINLEDFLIYLGIISLAVRLNIVKMLHPLINTF